MSEHEEKTYRTKFPTLDRILGSRPQPVQHVEREASREVCSSSAQATSSFQSSAFSSTPSPPPTTRFEQTPTRLEETSIHAVESSTSMPTAQQRAPSSISSSLPKLLSTIHRTLKRYTIMNAAPEDITSLILTIVLIVLCFRGVYAMGFSKGVRFWHSIHKKYG